MCFPSDSVNRCRHGVRVNGRGARPAPWWAAYVLAVDTEPSAGRSLVLRDLDLKCWPARRTVVPRCCATRIVCPVRSLVSGR